ncbi:hypothetical protein HC931_02005 [Candidatus Gracilibacteria bacterium]|jgi:hypothetical protein|nr:hypothetical protein [Candidatus Gracilibacteria bacterium]NJM86841.1 hypothetical protein [Hydrococcus sp. RU_2_2]NJP17875.1 hypothetical protein [Hydrococcus sp. CRU_1_1]
MMLYLGGAFLVCGILLNAFLNDKTTPKTHWQSWMCLIIATIIWPIVLPFIIRKKLSKVSLEEISLSGQDWGLDRTL